MESVIVIDHKPFNFHNYPLLSSFYKVLVFNGGRDGIELFVTGT